MTSLVRLRRRLTAWYVGTFVLILAVLGVALFATVTARFDAALDESLTKAANVLANTARTRDVTTAAQRLVVPDRALYVTDSAGSLAGGGYIDEWLAEFARGAAAGTARTISHSLGSPDVERILRAHAAPFRAADGRLYVALAVADEVEVEDQYSSLITIGIVLALGAVVLVGGGGWVVARQSTEPVERAMEHMRRFMADAAHELRTPLSVIRGRAGVALQRSRTQEEYADALAAIERESERMGGIVGDLLTLARADAGERPIDRQRVFLDDIVLDAVQAARTLAERASVRLEVSDFEETPVLGDAALLRQLALILLDNAVKFSPSKDGVVQVAVRRASGRSLLTVSDRGAGIPAEQLPHVFERFYRADAARPRVAEGGSEGVGLGLSIARWIADAHEATIRIESEYRKGTLVVVSFPSASPALSSS
jgi:signal transduction histidine kinase